MHRTYGVPPCRGTEKYLYSLREGQSTHSYAVASTACSRAPRIDRGYLPMEAGEQYCVSLVSHAEIIVILFSCGLTPAYLAQVLCASGMYFDPVK